MRFIFLLFVCILTLYQAQSLSEKCYEKIEECHSTNYQDYVNCIRKRQKRSVDCDSDCESDNCINTCNECDCNSCSYSACQNSCDSCCSTCCNNYNVCTNNHCCHKTCHAQCRSSSCRSSCRRSCYERIRNIDETSNSSSNSTNTNSNDSRHNITTIIHLNNVINNTNIIDIPISLNNTNQQNITLYENGNDRYNVGNQTQNCCTVISPRQCVPHNETPYFRCFHYRSKQCGDYCSAPIVHKEQQQICQTTYPGSAPTCRQSVIYIPQPQPRCTYQSTWPYVACGIPRSATCTGCYSHYVNPNAQDYINCPSACYDDGFGSGPYYRQGPVYRPSYSHIPCFTCFGYGGFGGYGAPYGNYPPIGGYPGYGGYQGGGYPPFVPGVGAGYGNVAPVSYGSWSPEVENTFERANGTNLTNGLNLSIDPLISVGPNLSPVNDPYRVSRELEIEVNYEPKSDAQAEVKIKNPEATEEEESDKINLSNSTESTSLPTKLS